MSVDWEERVRFDRLREERLARITALLAESELGALLCFDMINIRYITATHIGTWAQDKLNRFCLLPQGDEPIMWDFGSAARHHQLYNPWLGDGRSRAGISTLRGAMSPESGRAENVARKIHVELEQRGLLGEPVGVDAVEPAGAVRAPGRGHPGRRRPAAHAGGARDQDAGRDHAAQHGLHDGRRRLRGALPRDAARACARTSASALVNKVLYDMGSEHVEGVNAISGERCSPHPHVYTDRALRPGDPAYFDILHSFMGYRTCYYRTFAVASASTALVDAYKRCRYYLDAAIDADPPGRDDRRGRRGLAARRRSSASRTRRRPSRSSSATASGSRSGRSRSSAGSSRSTIRRRSRRAWCSRSRRSGRRATAGRRRASRSSSWSPRTAARSSRASRPRTW